MTQDRTDQLLRSWEDNARAWADAVQTNALASRRLVTDAAIVEAVEACAGGRVLDVGCGEGWLARRLAGAGRDVTGFDASARLIERARALGGADFKVLSYGEFVREPGQAGAGFDVVVCNFSVLDDGADRLFAGLRQVTRRGGSLLIQTLHPLVLLGSGSYEDGWREERFDGQPGEWRPMPWYFRTIGSWVGVLGQSGWQLEECREPLHPHTAQPASLILRATPTGS